MVKSFEIGFHKDFIFFGLLTLMKWNFRYKQKYLLNLSLVDKMIPTKMIFKQKKNYFLSLNFSVVHLLIIVNHDEKTWKISFLFIFLNKMNVMTNVFTAIPLGLLFTSLSPGSPSPCSKGAGSWCEYEIYKTYWIGKPFLFSSTDLK